MKIVEYGNSVDSDDAAHNESPHLDPHSLLSKSFNSKYCIASLTSVFQIWRNRDTCNLRIISFTSQNKHKL